MNWWRLWVGIQMGRAARAVEFFALGIMRPADLIELNRRYFMRRTRTSTSTHVGNFDLGEEEATIVNRFSPRPGSALILGCGCGREAIALAKRGWQVVGIENVPTLIAAAKTNAAQSGVHIEWHCHDITQGIPTDRSFDLISLLGQVYSYIPSRRKRVRLLKACREHLRPEGCCLLNASPIGPLSQNERWAQPWRVAFAWLVVGNRECQLGDRWELGTPFFHKFESLEELAKEAAEANLGLDSVSDETRMAILTALKPSSR